MNIVGKLNVGWKVAFSICYKLVIFDVEKFDYGFHVWYFGSVY